MGKPKKLKAKQPPAAASSSSSGRTPPSKKPGKKAKKKSKQNEIAAYYDDTPAATPSSGMDIDAVELASASALINAAVELAPTPAVDKGVAVEEDSAAAAAFKRGVEAAESATAFNRGVAAAESATAFNRGVAVAVAAAAAAAGNRGSEAVMPNRQPQQADRGAGVVLPNQQPQRPDRGAGAVPQQQNGGERVEPNAGFIFFCSESTKLECFSRRVFGLPNGRFELVQRIKPGARLFLYDFSVKLMYGIYRAITHGGRNLVPDAFGGNFPAQVQFDILEDCIPVHESVFRSAIEENYEFGSRFKPDLNSKQVRNLCALFHPVPISAAAAAAAGVPILQLPQQRPPILQPRPPFLQQPQQRPPILQQRPPVLQQPQQRPPILQPRPPLLQHPQQTPSVPQDPYRLGHPRVPPAFEARHGSYYEPLVVDRMPHHPPSTDARHGSQFGPPTVDARHGSQYDLPDVDPRHISHYGPPVDTRHGSHYVLPDVDIRHRSHYVPPDVDGRHGSRVPPQYGQPPAKNMHASAGHYLLGSPAAEPQPVASTTPYPNDQYYPEPYNDSHHQADARGYNSTSQGQPEKYQLPSGRDYRALTGKGAQQTPSLDRAYYPEQPASQHEYADSNQGYQRTTSMINTHSVPVSSRYAFAGAAPAYR